MKIGENYHFKEFIIKIYIIFLQNHSFMCLEIIKIVKNEERFFNWCETETEFLQILIFYKYSFDNGEKRIKIKI